MTVNAAIPSDEGLARVLGLRSAILLVVGSVIGSGIFLTTGGMAEPRADWTEQARTNIIAALRATPAINSVERARG